MLFGARTQILRERFEGHFARFRQVLLVCICAVLDQRALQQVVSLVSWIFSWSPFDGASEFVPHAMHSLGGEGQFLAVEFSRLEEMIEERATIAFEIAVAGDKSGHAASIFDSQLHEFAILQEGVHAGVVLGRLRGRIWSCILRKRKRARQQQHGGKYPVESAHRGIKTWRV